MHLIEQDNQLFVVPASQRYSVMAWGVALYFIAAVYCIYISRQPGSIAAIWYANAIIIAVLQTLSYRDWRIVLPLVGAANLLANSIFSDPILLSLSFIPSNLTEIALMAYLLRRYIVLKTVTDNPLTLLKIFALALPSLFVSGGLGAAILHVQGISTFSEIWFILCMGSATGIVSTLPLGLLIVVNGWSVITEVSNFFNIFITILSAILSALFSFVYLPDPYVYISATLIIVALVGRFTGTAIAVFTYSVVIGGLISFGFFTATMQGRYVNAESLLFMPLIMTLLQPLLLAAAIERISNNKPLW